MHARFARSSVFLFAMGFISAASLFCAPADIATSNQRQSAAERAVELARMPSDDRIAKNSSDPFNPAGFDRLPSGFGPVAAAAPITPTVAGKTRTSHEMLVLLAQTIQTTGMMTVRDRPTLVIKSNGHQLLAKIGDSIPVTFEGAEHPLIVSAITKTSYTVEWDGEKVTRPIRSDK